MQSISFENITIFINKTNVKNLNLRINGQGEVHLSAPYFTSNKRINKFLEDRKTWLKKAYKSTNDKLKKQQEMYLLPDKNYESGDYIYL